ncbi:UDP-glucuronic acid decarboxylase 2-like [Babesia caballi]|uniref:UDP-glucuronic acid decarboxylase 2-like n=1 Tax=Babesia caballi TaxID=5871 RepID=A0AAV4M0M2_BABCB|nr:UDP-glucuronic acid decarboxylase 2-like [Babesia caballi]
MYQRCARGEGVGIRPAEPVESSIESSRKAFCGYKRFPARTGKQYARQKAISTLRRFTSFICAEYEDLKCSIASRSPATRLVVVDVRLGVQLPETTEVVQLLEVLRGEEGGGFPQGLAVDVALELIVDLKSRGLEEAADRVVLVVDLQLRGIISTDDVVERGEGRVESREEAQEHFGAPFEGVEDDVVEGFVLEAFEVGHIALVVAVRRAHVQVIVLGVVEAHAMLGIRVSLHGQRGFTVGTVSFKLPLAHESVHGALHFVEDGHLREALNGLPEDAEDLRANDPDAGRVGDPTHPVDNFLKVRGNLGRAVGHHFAEGDAVACDRTKY